MNERIVKLFMQSVDSNYIPLPVEDHMPSWTEKFAELIVKECADMVAGSSLPDAYSEPVLEEIADEMREWFGVSK